MSNAFDWSAYEPLKKAAPKAEAESPQSQFNWEDYEKLPIEATSQQIAEEKRLANAEIPGVKSRTHALLQGVGKGIGNIASYSPVHGPISNTAQEKILEGLFPAREEAPERFTKRIAQGLTEGSVLGPQMAVLSGAGEALAQTAEEIGAPPWVQTVASLIPFLKGGGGLKGLIPKASQKEAVAFLKSKGLTDKQITPLLQPEKKLQRLGKFARKSESTRLDLKEAKSKLGKGYEALRLAGKEIPLERSKVTPFIDKFTERFDDLTPEFQKKVRPLAKELTGKPINIKTLMDFWSDLNSKMGEASVKGFKGGKSVIGIMKEPVARALKDISPEAYKEFEQLNKFYAKTAQTWPHIAPKTIDDIIDLGEALGIGGALASYPFNASKSNSILLKTLGVTGMRELTRALLTNPKWQNLSLRMGKALSKNQMGVYQKLWNYFKRDIEKKFPDLKGKLRLDTSDESKPSQT